jgi:ribosomal protein S18 acetylase RimI-like enzyme
LDDLGAVREVFRRASLSNDGDRPHLLANQDALAFSDSSVREGRTLVGCLADGRIVGFVTTEEHVDCVELVDLFVAPEWMRRGIGGQLVRDAVRVTMQCGLGRIEVTANGHALDFYKDVGFVVEGLVETRFGPGYRMHRAVSGPEEQTA